MEELECKTVFTIPLFGGIGVSESVAYCGLNLVGLRRRGFSAELIENIHNTYRLLYQREKLREECLAQIRAEVPMSKEIEYILDFVTSSKRGIIK